MSRERVPKTCDEAPDYHQNQGRFGIPLRPRSKGHVPALLFGVNIDIEIQKSEAPQRGLLSHHPLNLFISSPTTQVVHFKSIVNDLKVCVTYEIIP